MKNPLHDNPGSRFLDSLLVGYKFRNDAALCRYLDLDQPVISKVRCGRAGFTPALILVIHEKLDIPVAEIRLAIADTPT